ncbi:MAG: HAD family hydrolase [Methanosarcina sp.]|nr:HAD family hydrolase [Methanosarcina sp. Ant1]
MLKALIFDMDGVLVDSMPFHAAAWKKAFLDMGMEIKDEDIYAIEGSNPINGLPLLIRKARREPEEYDFAVITSIYRQEFERIFEIKAFEGMKECLELLKQRFLLSVVSGSDRYIVHGIVGQLFPGIFDTVITGDDVKNSKPCPDPFLKAVELLKVRREECIIIENAILGVEAAKKAEIYCIGVPTYLEPSQLDRADLVIDDHKKLMEHLLGLEPAQGT